MKCKFRTFVEIYKRVTLNKLYIFIIGLLIGGILVYFIGGFVPRLVIQNTSIVKTEEKSTPHNVSTSSKHKKKNSLVSNDTNNDANLTDSLALDSLNDFSSRENQDSSNIENEDVIDRDRLIKVSTLPIAKSAAHTDTSYSDKLASKIGKDESFQNDIVVELWESPLEYAGYKLNKSKLILYGISIDDELELSYDSKSDALKLSVNGAPTILRKTEQFKPIHF